MSDNSAKPILVAGAIGTVVLLLIGWWFAASSSRQAVVDAENYAASKMAAVESVVKSDEPAETVVAAVSAEGDAVAGAKVFRKCKACHKIGDGVKNSVGPYLTDVVGRVQGSIDGFKYSDGFKAAMAEGKQWTPAELDAWLTKPKNYMPGTKMAFGGLRKEKDRANVIAYLATNGE